jgi:carboxypeptidase family protein/TonB-dependent receptor-like protein
MRSSILRIGLAALVAASVAPRSVAAQGGLAGVAGSVVDSIHGGVPLQGAIIKVGDRQAKTDANGRFQVDSIPPGSYSLTLLHPLLDTLGISITTRAVPFQGGNTLAVEMAIPSAQTVLERSCAPAWRARGPSALVGKVLDADTDTPLVGAKVSLAWVELSLTTLRKEPRVRTQPVGPDGTYRICGLPGGIDGNVQAEFNGRKTAEVHVVMDEANPLAFQSLRIGTAVVEEAPADTTKRAPGAKVAAGDTVRRLRGPARLTGRVVNAAGAPVANARIDITGTGAAALSRQDGTFGFTDLPSGTQALVARQLGFEPVEMAVELSGREPRQVTVTMAKPARVLETVAVTAEKSKEGLDQVGFNQRKKNGFGYFMGPEQIQDRQATRMTDLFRSVPSLRVVPSGMDYVVESARDATGGCVTYVVDGSPYKSLYAGDVDRLMPPGDVAAIEVYSGSSTPAEFQTPGSTGCTTVVMWSKFKVKRDR